MVTVVCRCESVLRRHRVDDWLQTELLVETVLVLRHADHDYGKRSLHNITCMFLLYTVPIYGVTWR